MLLVKFSRNDHSLQKIAGTEIPRLQAGWTTGGFK